MFILFGLERWEGGDALLVSNAMFARVDVAITHDLMHSFLHEIF